MMAVHTTYKQRTYEFIVLYEFIWLKLRYARRDYIYSRSARQDYIYSCVRVRIHAYEYASRRTHLAGSIYTCVRVRIHAYEYASRVRIHVYEYASSNPACISHRSSEFCYFKASSWHSTWMPSSVRPPGRPQIPVLPKCSSNKFRAHSYIGMSLSILDSCLVIFGLCASFGKPDLIARRWLKLSLLRADLLPYIGTGIHIPQN